MRFNDVFVHVLRVLCPDSFLSEAIPLHSPETGYRNSVHSFRFQPGIAGHSLSVPDRRWIFLILDYFCVCSHFGYMFRPISLYGILHGSFSCILLLPWHHPPKKCIKITAGPEQRFRLQTAPENDKIKIRCRYHIRVSVKSRSVLVTLSGFLYLVEINVSVI